MDPNNQVIYGINQRIQLIENFITRCNISMHKYRPFLALMVKIKDELQHIMTHMWHFHLMIDILSVIFLSLSMYMYMIRV